MKSTSSIVIQLIHVEGPFKGQIQEFSKNEITIGRHPSCDSQMPKELTYISRIHAHISRENNLFKIKDMSTNGTFVNGKAINEASLKNGDMIVIAMGGPKLNFQTRMGTSDRISASDAPKTSLPSQENSLQKSSENSPIPKSVPPKKASDHPKRSPPLEPHRISSPESSPLALPSPTEAKIPFRIQSGEKVISFNEFPIVIGKHSSCHLILNQELIKDRHAQIIFEKGKFLIKDLSKENCIRINGRVIQNTAPLEINNLLALSPKGPLFKMTEEGVLSERPIFIPRIEKNPPDSPEISESEKSQPSEDQNKNEHNILLIKPFAEKFLKRLNFFQKKK